ncbi:MAG: hypothetical protein NVSMB24_04260 [Mucilaginibacter sp.]
MGSSTAAGNGATPPDSAWVNRVQATVNKNGTKANFINLAVPGYTTYQAMPTGYSAIYKPAPDTARNVNKALMIKPALVILNFPSNDVAEGYTDAEILNNYAVITHKLDSAKIQYIIFSTQPRDFPDPNQRMRLKTVNDKVIAVYTFHVNDFLDQLSTSTYSINPLYSEGDGIHINNAGHAIIGRTTLKHAIFLSVVN